jgi:hypothetical protein
MRNETMARNPKWYVASYGNMGLEVTFFTNKREYERAIRQLEVAHSSGGWDVDSYTFGDVEMPPRRKPVKKPATQADQSGTLAPSVSP